MYDTEDTATSLQRLGDADVLVEFTSDGTQAKVEGAWVAGELVPACDFAQHVVAGWRRAIEDELASDRADYADMQEELAL